MQPPAAVVQLLACLQRDGHEAVLVGGCVRDRLCGAPVRDWDIATSARPERSLALFPRAVPIGLRHGTIMAPCAAGPVDVTTFRGAGLAEDLALRDFTMNAMAWDPLRGAWHDPHGGRADLAARTLRAVGRAEDRLAEDPLRALRAARLVAALNLKIAPALLNALPGAAGALAKVAPERVRTELERLLLADFPGRGIALLRQSGLEAALLPGVRADGAALAAMLPADLELRLAAWLRGARAAELMARWRFPKNRARSTARLLALHPVDRCPRNDAAVRRLRKRARDDSTLARLLTLREAELQLAETQLAETHLAETHLAEARAAEAQAGGGQAGAAQQAETQIAETQAGEVQPGETRAAKAQEAEARAAKAQAGGGHAGAAGTADPGEIARAREALAALRTALARTRNHPIEPAALALDGRAVMEILGIGPGPAVGRALHHLAECILDDPAQNEPAALRALLHAWRKSERAPLSRDEESE